MNWSEALLAELRRIPEPDEIVPGPIERRWQSRLYRKVMGHWSPEVVSERLFLADLYLAEGNLRIERMIKANELIMSRRVKDE